MSGVVEREEHLFQVEVYETSATLRLYTVSACSREEAAEKAGRGDTEEEHDLGSPEVHHRQVMGETLEEVEDNVEGEGGP